MELFEHEKLFFSCDIMSTQLLDIEQSKNQVCYKLLCSISALYIYHTQYSNDTDEIMNRFESLLFYKAKHDDLMIEDYSLTSLEIYYNNKATEESFSFKFRYITEENLNRLKLLILLDGWKMARKEAIVSSSSNCNEYLYWLFDSLIMNDFTLIINEDFFEEETKLIKEFTEYLKILSKIKISVVLYEEEDKNLANNDNNTQEENEETYINSICNLFNLEVIDPSAQAPKRKTSIYSLRRSVSINPNASVITTEPIKIIPFIYLTHLDLSNTYINDKGFFKCIVPFLEKSPILKYLILSHNLLTNNCLSKFKEAKCIHLYCIDFSYNNFTSDHLLQWLVDLVNYFNEIEMIQLKGNHIDERLLIQMNPVQFDKFIEIIRQKFPKPKDKEKLIIDLRDNIIDDESLIRIAYKWKLTPKEFEYDMNDKNKKGENVKLLAMIEKFKAPMKYLQIQFDNPFRKISISYRIDNNYKKIFRVKCFNMKKRKGMIQQQQQLQINDKQQKEIDTYRLLFIYLFLIDFYFDPVLNSFNDPQCYYIPYFEDNDYINQYNHKRRYDQFHEYIKKCNHCLMSPKYVEENSGLNEIDHHSTSVKARSRREPILSFNLPLEHVIEMYMSYCYYIKFQKDCHINTYPTQILQYPLKEEFNPNAFIDHLYYFVAFLTNSSSQLDKLLPYTSLDKLLYRIKIEINLSYNENNLDSLKSLLKITKEMNMISQYKINEKIDFLTRKSECIDQGLIKIINFQGRDLFIQGKTDCYLKEINHFLDIFIAEAKMINYSSNPVIIGSYIQYCRNNRLRIYLENEYELMLKNIELKSFLGNMNSDSHSMYKKYETIKDYKILEIPDEVQWKMLSLHPHLIDYLIISEIDKNSILNDLDIIIAVLKDNECFGLRNIHDRIRFFLLNSSLKDTSSLFGYKLHRNNSYMKISRVLFRFFNQLDMPRPCYLDIKTMVYNETKYIQEDKNIIVIQSPSIKLPNEDYTITQIIKHKFLILKYSFEVLQEPLFDITVRRNIDQEDIIIYNKTTITFYSALLKTMLNLETVKSYSYLYRKIKELIRLFLLYQSQYKGMRVWSFINKEFLYLLLKFMNHDEMQFNCYSILRQYSFGIVYIMMSYLTFTKEFQIYIKQLILHLYFKIYYTSYCKGIFKALNSPYRSDWIPSCFEIRCRLESVEMIISLHYYDDFTEKYTINEYTTCLTLFNKIIDSSVVFKESKEKKLYWIYYYDLQSKEYHCCHGNEFVLELLGKLEDDLMIKLNEEELESIDLSEKYIFNHYQFWIRRRLFSPLITIGILKHYSHHEKLLMFWHLKALILNDDIFNGINKEQMKGFTYLLLLNYKQNKNWKKNAYGKDDLKMTINYLFDKNVNLDINEQLLIKIKEDQQTEEEIFNQFFKLAKKVPILFANIHKINLIKTYKELSTGEIYISIDSNSIKLLNVNGYKTEQTIQYEDIVTIAIDKSISCLILTIYFFDSTTFESYEEQLQMSSLNINDILYDIISYMQYFLAIKTKSSLTDCYSSDNKPIESNMKDYSFVYQRFFDENYEKMNETMAICNKNELQFIKEERKDNKFYKDAKARKDRQRLLEQNLLDEEKMNYNKKIGKKFNIFEDYNVPFYDDKFYLDNDIMGENDAIQVNKLSRIKTVNNEDSENKSIKKCVKTPSYRNELKGIVQNDLYLIVQQALKSFPNNILIQPKNNMKEDQETILSNITYIAKNSK